MRDDSKFPDVPFDAKAATAAGVTRDHLRRAVAEGVVRRIIRGIYVRADVPDTIELRCAAARMGIAPASIVCDRTAAWLHGVDVLNWHEKEFLPPVETCVFTKRSPTRRPDHDGHQRDLYLCDIVNLRGVPVTTPLRTALDLGCSLPRHSALAVLDAFMRLFGLTREQLCVEARRYVGRRGVRQFRALLEIADPRAESPAESWIRLDLIEAGLRPLEPQWSIVVDGVEVFRLDIAWPKHKVAVEYDGEEFHDRTEEQREHDRKRRKWLEDEGWIVVVVTRKRMTRAGKADWIAEVSDALASRRRRTRRF